MQATKDPVDSIVRELVILRQSGRLRKDAVPRAKELLTDLRQRGYTPEMVEEMTQGLWRVSIIKHYTVGVSADPSSQEPQETLAILTDFVKSGLTLERANQAVAVNKTIESEGASLEQVAELTTTASNSELGIAGLVSDVEKARESGIPMEELGQTLNYKKSLEEMGINNERLGKLTDIVTNQGRRNFDDTVKFMNEFNSGEALKNYNSERRATKNHLDAEINSRRSEIQTLRIEKESIQGSLDRFARLQALGFTELILAKLEQSSQIYGGPDNVLEAINQFGGLRNLYGAIEKARVDSKSENATLELLKAKHFGFAHAIGMCDELMQKGYDTSTIERIHHVAGSYGTPNEVLRAIDEYGSLGEIFMGHEKARDYDGVKQALDEEKMKTTYLEQKTADYEQVKKDKDEAQSKLADQDKRSIKILEDVLVQLENPPDQRSYPP